MTVDAGQELGTIYDEVVKRLTEAIDKNLNLVQQIGFILGEGASETERMLNSIIESYGTKKNR